MSNVFQGTGNVGDQPCLTTVLVGSEERQVRLALREAQRHGSYAASFHGFRVQARRNGPPRGSAALAEVCVSVRLGEALVARFAVLANHADAMQPKLRHSPCGRPSLSYNAVIAIALKRLGSVSNKCI